MSSKYFVGLTADLAQVIDWTTASGVALGTPAMEEDGVSDQRFAFSHPFSADDTADLNSRGAAYSMSVLDALPGDWRYPTEE